MRSRRCQSRATWWSVANRFSDGAVARALGWDAMVDASTALLAASLLVCYLYWWVALGFMRAAQFSAKPAAEPTGASPRPGESEQGPYGLSPTPGSDHSQTHVRESLLSRRRERPLILATGHADKDSAPATVAFDNKDQTASKAGLRGWGKRAMLAMNNHAEQLPQFGLAAVLNVAVRAGVTPWAVSGVMAAIAVFRGAHLAFYLADVDGLRSLSFLGSSALTLTLYAMVFVTF